MTDPARAAIRGELVFLRPLEPEDVDLVDRWYADGEFRWLMGQLPMSRAERRLRHTPARADGSPDVFHFIIARLEDGAPIGRLDLFEIDRVNGSAAFGIGIGERADRGRGYGSDAVDALLDFCFGELRLERVWLVTDAENAAAQRVYARCGFVEEARLRHAFFDRGRWLDAIRMSILRADWDALPRKRSWDRVAEAG